jgi:hypothetical protein
MGELTSTTLTFARTRVLLIKTLDKYTAFNNANHLVNANSNRNEPRATEINDYSNDSAGPGFSVGSKECLVLGSLASSSGACSGVSRPLSDLLLYDQAQGHHHNGVSMKYGTYKTPYYTLFV